MKKIVVILLTIAFLSGIYVFFSRERKVQKPLTPVVVSLKWLHQAQFAGLYVAKERGLYEKAGLDVRFVEYDSLLSQIDMLTSGKADFAVMNPTELFKAVDNGLAVKAIAAIYETSPYSLISLKESGINSPADFVGKTLGNKGGNPEAPILYDALLKEFNVDKTKVTFLSTGFDTSVLEDLLTKKVDVIDMFRTDQQYLFDQKGVRYTIMKPELFNFQSYGDVLVTTEKLMISNPDMISRFVQATIDGWDWALDHQDEAAGMTMKYVTNIQYQDLRYQKSILSQSEKLIRSAKSKPIGGMNYVVWRNMYDYLRRSGILSKDIDVRNVYTTEYLP